MSILKIFLKIVLFIFLGLGIFILFNFTRIKRIITYPSDSEITSTEWYTPKSIIKGKPILSYELMNSNLFSQSVLDSMADYAKNQNSSALLILHQNQLILEKYWNGADHQTTTNSMSMVKTIIGILIGKAVEDGLIKNENDKIADYLLEWKNDERANIRIKDLLLMQSGLRVDGRTDNLYSDLINLYLGTDVVDAALDIPAVKPPATIFEYNNANTQILGILLERITNKSIENYASEKLWQPLGNNDAYWWLDDSGGMPRAFCCFFARAQDWLRLGQLFLQKGEWKGQQIIDPIWFEKMLTQSQLEKDYGFHIWLMAEDGGHKAAERMKPFKPLTYIIDGKEKQHIFIVPEIDLVVLRIGERPTNWDESFIINTLYQHLKLSHVIRN